MAIFILALAAAATSPSPSAIRLGRLLAEHGMLASILPLMKAKEIDELVAEDPHLSVGEQVRLRATAERVYRRGYERLMAATGEAYARQLSMADLKALVRFNSSPVATRYRSVTPTVIQATMKSVGQLDFKGDVRKAFCAEVHRLCAK